MKKNYTTFSILACMLFLSFQSAAQAPVITAVSPVSNMVEQYGKFEAALAINATFTNPYNYDEIRVSAVFTAPNGLQFTVDGFYMENFSISNETTGALSATGNNGFKVRFAPMQTGTWSYTLSCTNAAGTGTFPAQTFVCTETATATNKGFVRSNATNYLGFDNGNSYIPIGENIGWANANPYVDYKKWVTKLADNGGNFFRIWNCSWGLGLEWKNTGGYLGLKKYRQNNAFYLDWLFDFSAEKGVYAMLCINHHGQVSSQVNPNWSDNPYNAVNGGPCQNTWDFFTNAQAKALHKNRLRYMVARWGYQRGIMAWELFNEVDWTDQFDQRKGDVANWHNEMAAYLKQIDPYQHVVTTSYAHDHNDPQTWNLPDIDLTQTHYYLDIPNLERVLASGNSAFLDDFGKPTLNGEFGLGGSSSGLIALDPTGIHIHNNLWGGLFSGAAGTGMSWWWDSYLEPQNLYTHFSAIRAVTDLVDLQSGDFRPVPALVSGAPSDLSLTPSLGWGALADTSFTINADGSISPVGAKLSQFLYGSQWNTQYRRPPVFYVDYPQSGNFSVKTGGTTGQAAKIAIWVDGVQLLNTTAAVNQLYTVTVPSGAHTIRVDNTGTDWVTLASYNFSGLGSAVDAYVLRSEDHTQLTGWVLNNNYNHQYVKANGEPNSVSGATIAVSGLSDGLYTLNWYDCINGGLLNSAPATVSNSTFTAVIPDVLWDVTFTLRDYIVGVTQAPEPFSFGVYPNPVTDAGSNMSFDLTSTSKVQVELLDAGARPVQLLVDQTLEKGTHLLHLPIKTQLPSGIYWIKARINGQTGIKPISIIRD